MRALLTLTAKDLRQRLRDRSFFLFGIATPFVLAFTLNLVFGDIGQGRLEVNMAVVDDDGSPAGAQVHDGIAGLDGEGGFSVTSLAPGTDPQQALEEHEFDGVVVIGPGFGEAVGAASGQAPRLIVVGQPDRPVQAGIVQSVAEGFAANLERTRLRQASAAQLGVETGQPADAFEVSRETLSGDGLDPSSRLMAGIAVMFVFFTVQFGVTTLLDEQQAGTMTRLLAAPVPRAAVAGSKALVGFLLGVAATLLLFATASVLMDASWGPWTGIVVLVCAATLSAVAMMAVVASVARTSDGASGVQSSLAIGFAVLGGSWFEVPGEGVVGTLAKATPHWWFLGALEEMAGTSSIGPVWPAVGAMVVIALVTGVPATVLLLRRLSP